MKRPTLAWRAVLAPFTASWTAWWATRLPRERALVVAAAALVGLALLWAVAVAPAWRTLRNAPERHAALDAQLAQMQQLAQTAQALRANGGAQAPGRDEALRALEAATAVLGATGQLSVLGDRATLTLRGADAQALAGWLQQARINARLLPVQAQLRREAGGAGWGGSVVLAGPALAPN